VASQLFIDAAASPPWQGGENAQTEQSGNSFTASVYLATFAAPFLLELVVKEGYDFSR